MRSHSCLSNVHFEMCHYSSPVLRWAFGHLYDLQYTSLVDPTPSLCDLSVLYFQIFFTALNVKIINQLPDPKGCVLKAIRANQTFHFLTACLPQLVQKQAMNWTVGVQFQASARDFSVLQSVHTGSEIHPAYGALFPHG
jgi:hypothetical protein